MRYHELAHKETELKDGSTLFSIDIDQSRWFGKPVRQLGAYGRRRFENWVVLERPKKRIKIAYNT